MAFGWLVFNTLFSKYRRQDFHEYKNPYSIGGDFIGFLNIVVFVPVHWVGGGLGNVLGLKHWGILRSLLGDSWSRNISVASSAISFWSCSEGKDTRGLIFSTEIPWVGVSLVVFNKRLVQSSMRRKTDEGAAEETHGSVVVTHWYCPTPKGRP